MTTTTNNAGAIETRDIPPLPGGGSWTFDESKWAWVSNDPVPAEEAAPAAADEAAATTTTDEEQ